MAKKMNKELVVRTGFERIKKYGQVQQCRKLSVANFVFPAWDEIADPFLGSLFQQCIRTKEQPDGCIYDAADYCAVIRILGGRLRNDDGQFDIYAWNEEKAYKELCKGYREVGLETYDGLENLYEVLSTIKGTMDKMQFFNLVSVLRCNLKMVVTEQEQRSCVEITQELYDNGMVLCIDEWMETDSEGYSDCTLLNVGDFLIINERAQSMYRIGREEFLETHELLD